MLPLARHVGKRAGPQAGGWVKWQWHNGVGRIGAWGSRAQGSIQKLAGTRTSAVLKLEKGQSGRSCLYFVCAPEIWVQSRCITLISWLSTLLRMLFGFNVVLCLCLCLCLAASCSYGRLASAHLQPVIILTCEYGVLQSHSIMLCSAIPCRIIGRNHGLLNSSLKQSRSLSLFDLLIDCRATPYSVC